MYDAGFSFLSDKLGNEVVLSRYGEKLFITGNRNSVFVFYFP